MSNRRIHLLFILIIVVLSCIAYCNTLKNGFVYDDKFEIVDNVWIRSFKNLFSECHRYRLTETLTLFVDYKLWGLKPLGFHFTSLLFHILTSAAIYAFAYLVQKEKKAAFLTGILFATHPIHTEAVSVIAHRQEILVMLAMTLGLIFYIKQKRANNYWFLVVSCIFFALSLGAKEVAFVFPLLLLLYAIYFEKEKPEIKHYLPYLILFGIFLLLFSIPSPRWNFKISGIDAVSFGHSLSGNRTYLSILLTQLKGFAQYVKLLILPHPLNIDYYFLNYTSIFQNAIFLSLLLLLLLIFLTIITYKRNKIISFGIAWSLINLLPVSNILPKTFFVAERYLYIPSFGFCLILGWLLSQGISKKSLKIPSMIILGIIITLYSYKTIERNFDFRSEYTLGAATLKNNPQSVHGHNNLGIGLLESGKTQEAIKEFETTIQLAPTFAKPYYNLGITFYRLGDYKNATENLKTSIKFDPKSAESHAALGIIYQKLGQCDLAVKNIQIALNDCQLGQDASLHYSLGTAYRDVGRFDEAIVEFKKTVELNPNLGEAHNDLGIEYGKKSLYDDAIIEFGKAISLINQPSQVYYNLGFAYMKKADYTKAIQVFQNSLKYWSGDTVFKNNIQKLINDLKAK